MRPNVGTIRNFGASVKVAASASAPSGSDAPEAKPSPTTSIPTADVDEFAACQLLTSAERKRLTAAAASLATGDAATTSALSTDADLARAFADRPVTTLRSATPDHRLVVDRTAAGVASWYEFFPRSEGAKRLKDGTVKSGTFRSATKRLPGVAAMGFDVLYLVPIHPIGTTNRK